ncbi:unnamed protein product [Polarella glacialis]|uniref:acetylornithine transaminase n=2 Tax=Polarella glacialis TaxID=89957 RepID=A0A813IZY2_POLGL|nr:unnamed protein product [Polarella glacialis]
MSTGLQGLDFSSSPAASAFAAAGLRPCNPGAPAPATVRIAAGSSQVPKEGGSSFVSHVGLAAVSVAALAATRSAQGRRRGSRASAKAVVEKVVEEVAHAGAHALDHTHAVQARAETSLLNNYGKRSLAFTHGEGSWLYDVDGRKFLDMTAGIAVNCLGHSDPGWVETVAREAGRLCHTSNLYLNPHQVALGEKLIEISFADKAFFCNSGTEANEAAIKFARKFHYAAGKPREKLIAFENAFHGRTMGALALTYKQAYKTPFEPILGNTEFLRFNDPSSLGVIDEETCAVFVEPMQGEGGVIPASKEFMVALRKRCDEVGAILVFDEVQCGLGRTGHLFGYELTGVIPDLLTLAKPLAGGLPIGAVLLTEKVAACINPGDHGSTFAGAPLVCAAGNYTVGRISEPAFLDHVKEMGERLRAGLWRIAEPRGLEVRGEGLLVGLVFATAEECGAVKTAAEELFLLVLTAGAGNVMRIAPALTVTAEDLDEALRRLEAAFASYGRADVDWLQGPGCNCSTACQTDCALWKKKAASA